MPDPKPNLLAQLRARFGEQSLRRAARRDPQTLIIAGTAITLGTLLAAPAFAASTAGVILGGIAINFATDWLKALLALPPDATDAREDLLEQGLAARDPAALAVTAATLVAGGPVIAAALPDPERGAFVAGFDQAMRAIGGPPAALAPAYAAALANPEHADWQAIHTATQEQIRIVAKIQAGERAMIARSGITIADVAAAVDAQVLAGDDAQITDSPINIQGVQPPPTVPAHYNIRADAGGAVSNSPLTVNNITNADPDVARRGADLLSYLEHTLRQRNALDLSKIDPTDTTYARPMELARVYIALNTTTSAGSEERQRAERQRPLSAVETLAHAPQGRVMLLGAPGGGKSTFVSYLAHCLAEAARAALLKAPDAAEILERLPGWRHGALIPVPIILRDLAAMPAVAQAQRGSVGLITDFIRAQMAELGCPHAAEPLITALRAGKALLLLDGFDEVVGDAVLPRVAEAISAAAQAFPGPILVTCRVLDYQEQRLRQLAGFPSYTLADLEPEQITNFIGAWYAELAASGRRPATQAAAEARRMQGAVQSRDELLALAGTPLLLTLMAQVHAFRGTLPDARARLYEECIDLLLLSWRQSRAGEPDLITSIGLSRFDGKSLLTMMALLGFTAHTLAERDQQSSGPADLSEAQVLEVLAERFADYDADPVRCQTRAATVLHALAGGNGLLLKRGPKTYTFAHRTFQEFLAGFHLKSMRNAQAECLRRAKYLHWHEALLLMAGYQVVREGEERPLALAEKLLPDGPVERCLAGEILVLVGVEQARGFDPGLVARNGLWPRAIRALRALQSDNVGSEAPATVRYRAGLALGRLCYGDLKTLATPETTPYLPDPRLPLAMINTSFQAQPGWRRALEEHYWCSIAPGPFWSGDDRNKQLQPATIHTPYKIARYPVTNADYARFLAANGPDGYDPHKPWWTEQGRVFLAPGGHPYDNQNEAIAHPRLWSVARYNGPLQPVVGVSWYEAAAYCRWLTMTGYDQGWLPADQEIRLPTWHEWERAARHTDQRRYPWGNASPDVERANYKATGIGAPSPVGSFPQGAAVSGALDMLGNTLEWTSSPWEKWEQTQKDFTANARTTISFTYFADDTNELCCGARDRRNPGSWDDGRSFRVTQSLRARS